MLNFLQPSATECDANNAICNASHSNTTHLTVVSKGPCLDLHSSCTDANQPHSCPHTNEYICATNGYTYGENEITLLYTVRKYEIMKNDIIATNIHVNTI